ncbi:MAG: carboxypeptidase regulatory-like domain-containing protein [Pirellulaceae bacterium]
MRSFKCLVMLLALGCLGCGSATYGDLGRVSGKVTLDGQPLPNAQVCFQPSQGRPSFGMTDSNGNYELVYTATSQGAAIGTHSVHLTTATDADGNPKPELVPANYRGEKSELRHEVSAGDNKIDLELTSASS